MGHSISNAMCNVIQFSIFKCSGIQCNFILICNCPISGFHQISASFALIIFKKKILIREHPRGYLVRLDTLIYCTKRGTSLKHSAMQSTNFKLEISYHVSHQNTLQIFNTGSNKLHMIQCFVKHLENPLTYQQ